MGGEQRSDRPTAQARRGLRIPGLRIPGGLLYERRELRGVPPEWAGVGSDLEGVHSLTRATGEGRNERRHQGDRRQGGATSRSPWPIGVGQSLQTALFILLALLSIFAPVLVLLA